METVLKIQNVSKKFATHTALKNISFELHRGEIIGFLGPSGAGKTTTIKIVTGQLRQSSGTATLLGKDSRDLTHDIYQNIGIVTDNSGVYENATVWENLTLYAKLLNVSTDKIDSLLTRMNLDKHKKTKAGKLSKGQKQRLILIRALLHQPQILFLDEPTSGLDPATTIEVHKVLLEMQQAGMAIFLTTHDMNEASKLCNHVALLNDGEVVEFGTPTELSLKYYQKKEYSIILDDQSTLTLDDSRSNTAEIIHECIKSKQLVSIHSTEPSLEEVFLKVTGRELV
ncbi:ABC-2 type transport system ATP-binding protein [Enterococcus sp. AZ194]|uniref:ABC transporter ATP-binding protein n=1 Tax=Enterococcus sp. AZ194 TaxID=2774629 RepID=UPI003F256D0B